MLRWRYEFRRVARKDKARTPMARRTTGTKWQPRNKPQGGGIPACEGLSTDVRLTMGAQMVACVEVYADAEGVSMSAWIRNAVRAHLETLGTTFR